jgi:hypothetical protein
MLRGIVLTAMAGFLAGASEVVGGAPTKTLRLQINADRE